MNWIGKIQRFVGEAMAFSAHAEAYMPNDKKLEEFDRLMFDVGENFPKTQTLYAIKDVESGEFVGYSHVFKCYELTDIRTAEFYSYPIHAENVVLAIKDRPTLIENKQIARFASSLKIVTLTVIEEVGE